jgi:hypothetical protein
VKVGVDLDGVVFDFVGAFTDTYTNWFGFPLAGEIKQWDDPLKLSHFEDYRDLFAWCDRADVWGNCQYVPGARAGIEWILGQGHQITFVTSRQGGGAEAAQSWYRNVFTGMGNQVSMRTNLGHAKHNAPCSVYVEDSPHVLKELKANDKRVICFDRPWNRHLKPEHRATSWLDVVDLIGQIDE